MTPASMMEPAAGASTWASGSQVCSGKSGTLMATIEVGARRHSGQAPFLRPDGKTLVQVEADAGGCPTVRQIVVSAQHVPEATPAQICMMVHSIVPDRKSTRLNSSH